MSATIYFSVCVLLTEVSTELGFVIKGKYKTFVSEFGLVFAYKKCHCYNLNRDRTYFPIHVSVLITSLFGAVLES